MTKAGWWGYAPGGQAEGPPDDAYDRVTNPERFRPLHAAMLEIIGQLESDYEVERKEGYGLDEELESRRDPARPSVMLSPRDAEAAPVGVTFSKFPGLYLRLGRWYTEPFPDCGCDACDETAEDEIQRLKDIIDDVTAGRFREAVHRPLISFMGTGWVEKELWSPDERRTSTRSFGRSRVDALRAREMAGGRRRLDLRWKPWPHRKAVG